MNEGPCVVVTDAERTSALAIIRSLARHGCRVVAASADARVPAWRSRATAVRARYPDPLVSADRAAEAVLSIAERVDADLILPVSDDIGLPLATIRERASAPLCLPGPTALAAVNDKIATLDLARSVGVPYPPTRVVGTVDEALEVGPSLGWPIVVKPAVSRRIDAGRVRRYAVAYAHDPGSLRRQVAELEGEVAVLLQGFVPGEGHGIDLLLHDGRPVAAFQHRRIHEVPVTGGASSLRESVALDATLLELAVRLLEPLRWTGLAMVEFRIDDGQAVLMEINGRVWGSIGLPISAGMDFPARLVDLMLDPPEPPASVPDTAYRVGVTSRNPELEIVWVGSVLRGGASTGVPRIPPRSAGLRGLLGFADPRIADDVFSWADPGPGLVTISRMALKVARKARQVGRGG